MYISTNSLQCRRIFAGRVDIYFHRMFRPPSWNRKTVESWGKVKSLPRVGERKKNSVILAPILPVCSESKIAAKHSIDHQNRLHCRLRHKQKILCCDFPDKSRLILITEASKVTHQHNETPQIQTLPPVLVEDKIPSTHYFTRWKHNLNFFPQNTPTPSGKLPICYVLEKVFLPYRHRQLYTAACTGTRLPATPIS